MLKLVSTTPLGVTNISSPGDIKIRIESGSFVFDNRWINYKSKIFSFNDYVEEKLKERDSFFANRRYAVYLVIGINIHGTLSVQEGEQVPFREKEGVPPPKVVDLPLTGFILVQDGTGDLNYGVVPVEDADLIAYSGLGNILEKDKQGVTGLDSLSLGERGVAGATGVKGARGVTGFQGLQGIQGPNGKSFIGPTGVQGVTGLLYDSEYDTGLSMYLKMDEAGEVFLDSSGHSIDVTWGATGLSYHSNLDAVLCGGQSVVNFGQDSSFKAVEGPGQAIPTDSMVISTLVSLDKYPDSKTIIASLEETVREFLFYIDKDGKLNFKDINYRWISNSKVININQWALLEFHKSSAGVGRMFKTIAASPRAEIAITRITEPW